jgi:ADP-ribose pyrophosphatase YjhB (NUDIX family)
MKYGETWLSCAIREVKEETGLDINQDDFLKAFKIKNTSFYFYLEMRECDLMVQHTVLDNDANGIGWIKITCLLEMINNKQLEINKHCKILINKFLKINI